MVNPTIRKKKTVTRKRAKFVDTQGEAYARVKNLMKTNLQEANNRIKINEQLANPKNISLQKREYLSKKESDSWRLSRKNLDSIDYLEKKYDLDLDKFPVPKNKLKKPSLEDLE